MNCQKPETYQGRTREEIEANINELWLAAINWGGTALWLLAVYFVGDACGWWA